VPASPLKDGGHLPGNPRSEVRHTYHAPTLKGLNPALGSHFSATLEVVGILVRKYFSTSTCWSILELRYGDSARAPFVTMSKEKPITATGLAAALGVTPGQLGKWEKAGLIPKVSRDVRNRRLYYSHDIEEVLENCRQQGLISTIAEVRGSILRLASGVEVLVARDGNVCGGAARILGTRIPLWTIVNYRDLGLSDEEILENYPSLRPHDLEIVFTYYELHREEIDTLIRFHENGD
jgi:uncharacterized protein (DUF433 family)